MQTTLKHGDCCAKRLNTRLSPTLEWLDLLTGINPISWSVSDIPAEIWQRLPEDEDNLLASAACYYQTESL